MASEGPLRGRVALVTGARRVGGAVAMALADVGVDVAVTYRRRAVEAVALEARLEATGVRGRALAADLSQPLECARVVDLVVEEWGRLDILVNVASQFVRRPFEALDETSWQQDLAVDLEAALWCTRAAVPQMRRQGFGRVITCTDWAADRHRPRYSGYLGYYVAKSCAIALTEALALELAGSGVLVNAVAAGPIEPPEGATEKYIDAARRATPLGQWGGVGAIAAAVLSLVRSDFITGETLRVDGGRGLC